MQYNLHFLTYFKLRGIIRNPFRVKFNRVEILIKCGLPIRGYFFDGKNYFEIIQNTILLLDMVFINDLQFFTLISNFCC